MSLAARHLEANGIPTIIIGSARDIVEHCGVPRFLFTDFPLGNPTGPPYQRALQHQIMGLALNLLATATTPRTTLAAPIQWTGDPDWRPRYGHVDPAEITRHRAAGEARRRHQAEAAQKRDAT